MNITVLNKYTLSDPLPGVHREVIMRGTPLGNPFVMKDRSQAERDRVCDRYREWLEERSGHDGPVRRELQRLLEVARRQPVELVCCCAPKRCHGDVIREFLLRDAGAG